MSETPDTHNTRLQSLVVAKSRDKAAVTMTTLPPSSSSSSSCRVCRLNSHDKETVAELKKANNALRTETHTHEHGG